MPALQSVAKYFPPLVDAMVAHDDTRALMLAAPRYLLEQVGRQGVGGGGGQGAAEGSAAYSTVASTCCWRGWARA